YHSGYCSVTYLINESQLGYHSDMSLDKLLMFGPLVIGHTDMNFVLEPYLMYTICIFEPVILYS
ncbi:MAG: hypothetical protein WAL42_12710, partial [Nitrososphaeraceae archaeon]